MCFRFPFPWFQTDSGANSFLTEEAKAVLSLGVNRPGSEAGHSHHPVLMLRVHGALPPVTPHVFFDVVHTKAKVHPSLLHLALLLVKPKSSMWSLSCRFPSQFHFHFTSILYSKRNKLNILCNDTIFFRWWSCLVSQLEFKGLEVAVKASALSASCNLCRISWRVYVLVVRSPCSLLGAASDTKVKRARAVLIATRILVTIWRSWRFLMWGRALEGVSAHCSSYITDGKDTTLVCALLLRSRKTEKREQCWTLRKWVKYYWK